MRLIILVFTMMTAMHVYAQTKLHISDSAVIYQSYPGWEEIDSVVFIPLKERLFYCEPYEVYYDKKFTVLAFQSEVRGDTCIASDYWRNGKLKKKIIHIINANGSPVWWYDELYCENGTLIFKGPSPNQEGKKHYINYYCNGNPRIEFDHLGTGADGKMTTWYENGNIESESYYDHDVPIGVWKYYSDNGKLSKTERYENGELIETVPPEK